MKKKLFIPSFLIFIIFGFFIFGNNVLAITCSSGQTPDASGTSCVSGSTSQTAESPVKTVQDVFQVLTNILNLMYTAFFIIAIMFILIAAFSYLFAKDDPEKIKSATRQIMWAAVAIIIALVSVGAGKIVENFLKGGTSINPEVNTAFAAVSPIKGGVIEPDEELELGTGIKIGKEALPKGVYEEISDVGGVMNIVAGVIQVMYTMLFVLAVGFAILAGYSYLFAAEDPEKIKTAHNQLIWAAVAVAVGLLSVGINQIVESFITG